MAAGPDPGAAVPEHWLAVLEAVAAVCADEDSDSAPTGHIARRLPATRSGSGRGAQGDWPQGAFAMSHACPSRTPSPEGIDRATLGSFG